MERRGKQVGKVGIGVRGEEVGKAGMVGIGVILLMAGKLFAIRLEWLNTCMEELKENVGKAGKIRRLEKF